MQRENFKAAQKTLKRYHQEFKKNGSKSKFSIVQHKRRLKKSSGLRGSKRKKWMWEQEFVEEMAKTEHGNMSKQEATAEWEKMKNTPGARTDHGGPRGALRMKVAIGDYESSFSEFADEEEQEALGTVKKKGTEL